MKPKIIVDKQTLYMVLYNYLLKIVKVKKRRNNEK